MSQASLIVHFARPDELVELGLTEPGLVVLGLIAFGFADRGLLDVELESVEFEPSVRSPLFLISIKI